MDSIPASNVAPPEPPQPDESAWRFVQDLQSPLWSHHDWASRKAKGDEADLSGGVRIEAGFDDPEDLLATAYDDLRAFLAAGNVRVDGGYPIQTRRIKTAIPETFRLDTNKERCVIEAGDTEGIRRGIFHVEDQMRRADGAFLPLGIVERRPVIRTRISRCFFGPINRPPKKRDELADNVNYYPDNYLNRLAHDGVNALWLTVKFRDLCRSKIFPKFGLDSDRRLEKLRLTVKRCARYGIKIYPFCIEPAGFGDLEYLSPRSDADAHPELLGHSTSNYSNFCTSTDIGKEYLEEATFNLFSAVPGLGGLIAIQLGERPTHCYSEMSQLFKNNCPRCSKRHPGEVFAEVWSSMARGMHKVNPSAELISWLYTPYILETLESTVEQKTKMIGEIAAHAPPQVTVQVNFESGGSSEQFGRPHPIDDYSLSYIGPSRSFANCANEVRRHGGRMGAKLQVANSHEVATSAYVPVPGNLYQKYDALHRLGVSSVMQCWYFGNYPSVMTKAAGELSFSPFPSSEDQFLKKLAALYWPHEAPQVVQAWKYFQEAYTQFPAVLNFSWFGPVHDSVVWPLHLIPVDQPISPSWLLGYPPSGDRIGECIGLEFTLDECLTLCRKMADSWNKGVAILEEVVRQSGRGEDDLNVASAMGIQLTSTFHVLNFYSLREQLPEQPQAQQSKTLDAMRQLVRDEIAISRRLAEMAAGDSRLGFHSEAEGYKYFSEKLLWRAALLEEMLKSDFPKVQSAIDKKQTLFGQHTGATLTGAQYACRRIDADRRNPAQADFWSAIPRELFHGAESDAWQTRWQAVEDGKNLILRVTCQKPEDPAGTASKTNAIQHVESVVLYIESRRIGPSHTFYANSAGQSLYGGRRSGPAAPWQVQVENQPAGWTALFTIPFACLGPDRSDRPRINIRRNIRGRPVQSWVPLHPARYRLLFNTDNPADYGWLLHEKAM